MNPDPAKLRQQQQAEAVSETQVNQAGPSGQEFQSLEEMIRFDASKSPVPDRVAERLKESIAREAPPPPRSWWQRLFGSR